MPSLDKVNLCLQMLLAILVSQELSYLQFSEDPCQPWAFAWPSGKTLPLLVLCVSVKVLLEFWTFLHPLCATGSHQYSCMNGRNVKLAWPGHPTCADNESYGMPLPDLYQGSQHSEVSLVHWLHKLRFDLQASALPAYPKEVWSSLHQSKQETEV